MSVIVTQRPQKTVNENIPEVSKWTAVWHPVIFRLQRRDAEIISVSDITGSGTGGGINVTIDGDYVTDPDTAVTEGSTVYFSTDTYHNNYTVLSVTLNAGNTDLVLIGDNENVNESSGYLNFITDRSYYLIELRILEYATTSLPLETTTDYPQYRASNNAGDIKADVQKWLQPLINANSTFNYDSINAIAPYLGQPFNIQIREYWKENGYTDWSAIDDDNKHYIINAAKQVGDRYGQNMGEFVLFPPDTTTPQYETSKGKFLTKFDQPVYFPGFPFDISFIYSKEYDDSGLAVNRVERLLDINHEEISSDAEDLTEYPEYVNRMMLAGDYSNAVKYISFSLGWLDAYVVSDYVDEDYVDDEAGEDVSEQIIIEVDHTCYTTPEYLRWLNPFGGFDYWLFHSAQDIHDTITNEQTFETFIEDLSTVDSRQETMSKDSQEEITLAAENLSIDKIQGIRHLLASPKVYRFIEYDSETNIPKWQVVGIKTGTFLIEKTDENKAKIEFVILPPKRFTQRQ